MIFEKQKDETFRGRGEPGRKDLAAGELGHLASQHVHVMAENEEYVVLRAMADHIPNALHEIGRLREEVRVELGESTRRGVDLDYFDLYYLHMVLWDKKTGEIAGACRIGQVDIILKRFGHDGLATGAIFRYSPVFLQETGPALELGKAFIRREYRDRFAPAALLWKGIGRFISYNPHYRALITHVPVSGRYSGLSRDLMLAFLKKNRFSPKLAKLVRPAEPEDKTGSHPKGMNGKTHLKSLAALSRVVSEIETDGKRVPADMKHCLALGSKLMSYRTIPSSAGKLDLLFVTDMMKCGRTLLGRFMGKTGMERFLDYHDDGNRRAA